MKMNIQWMNPTKRVLNKRKPDTKTHAAWFRVHPVPKQALGVRTVVKATSWGPEKDNGVLLLNPGAG